MMDALTIGRVYSWSLEEIKRMTIVERMNVADLVMRWRQERRNS